MSGIRQGGSRNEDHVDLFDARAIRVSDPRAAVAEAAPKVGAQFLRAQHADDSLPALEFERSFATHERDDVLDASRRYDGDILVSNVEEPAWAVGQVCSFDDMAEQLKKSINRIIHGRVLQSTCRR